MRFLTGLARESSIPATSWPQETGRDSFVRASQMNGLFVIESPDQSLGQAMAEAACATSGKRLLTIDLSRTSLDGLARKIRLIQRLEDCALCVTGTQALWGAETILPDETAKFEAVHAADAHLARIRQMYDLVKDQ